MNTEQTSKNIFMYISKIILKKFDHEIFYFFELFMPCGNIGPNDQWIKAFLVENTF